MNRTIKFLFLIIFSQLMFSACQRESEVTLSQPAEGIMSLSSDGQCSPATVNGLYIEDSVLNGSHTIETYVYVSKTGRYSIMSDSLNGFYFKDTGIFKMYGLTKVVLKGYGAPQVPGSLTKAIHFNGSTCYTDVYVGPPGSQAALFNLDCNSAAAEGVYRAGIYSTSDDQIRITVNFISSGVYFITTPLINGISFSVAGYTPVTGPQTITLRAKGTPVQAGSFMYNVNGCNVVVTVE